MSYCRNPYYIYSDGDLLHLDNVAIDENMINVFLYELVRHRKDELNERVKKGKEAIDNNIKETSMRNERCKLLMDINSKIKIIER